MLEPKSNSRHEQACPQSQRGGSRGQSERQHQRTCRQEKHEHAAPLHTYTRPAGSRSLPSRKKKKPEKGKPSHKDSRRSAGPVFANDPRTSRLLAVSGSAVGGYDGEIAFRPAHAWSKLGVMKPFEKVTDSIGEIDARIQRSRIRYLAVRHDDVAHDETTSWIKPLRDPAEEVGLPPRSQVMHGKRGHN
jgi:hypothetical protein